MPILNLNKTRNLITLLCVIFVLVYLMSLFFVTIPVENKELVNIVLGAILVRLDEIVGYYFKRNDSNE